MKFLMYSESGEGAGILKRIEQEGNEVGLYVHDKIYKDVWTGLINKVHSPESFIDSDTVIIFDMSGNGDLADKWRRTGHLVYGASALMDQLENDRDFGFSVMQKCGIQVPGVKKFKNFQDAIAFVEQSDTRYVFKPCGCMPCKLTYVSKDKEELIAYLKFVEKRFKSQIDDFILQDFVEGSVISSEAFCDGRTLLRPLNHTVEVKKSMNDDLGPSTGCSGNTTWGDSTRIMKEGILLAEDWCVKNNYVGQLDLNAVVNEQGVFGLEWTPRWGYDATPTFLSLLNIDFGEFFYNICKGTQKEIPLSSDYASAVRFSVPPYPAEMNKGVDSEKFSPNEGMPIQNWQDYDKEIYFYEVMLEEEQLVHSSGIGVLGLALGQEESVEASFKEPYKILENLHIPDMQYRTDLDTVLSSMVEEIQQYA